jgi:hypothetical protein
MKSNKKLVKLLSILREETSLSENDDNIVSNDATYTVEMPRNSKYSNVKTDRDTYTNDHAEITACQPNMHLTLMDHQKLASFESRGDLDILHSSMSSNTMSDMPSDMIMLQDNTHTRSSMMRRSLAKINLNQHNQSSVTNSCLNINEGDSIVSTAEEHLTQLINFKQNNLKFKPKSTSSTTSLFDLIKKQAEKCTKKMPSRIAKSKASLGSIASMNGGVMLNVEFTSTPKKQLPRSSTPKTLKKSSLRKVVKDKQQQHQQPFSSTVISEQAPKIVNSVVKKCIPPPLLSSSSYKGNMSLITKNKNVSKRTRSSFASCKQCNIKPKRLSTKLTKKSSVLLEQACQMQPNYFKNFKFPIKYLPNKKTKDIDRLNSVDDCKLNPPTLKTCYSFGDYNVWIL